MNVSSLRSIINPLHLRGGAPCNKLEKHRRCLFFYACILNVNKFPLIYRHKKTALCAVFQFVAERGGFEPPVQCYSHAGLANRWIKPLSHLSGLCLIFFCACKYRTCFFYKKINLRKNLMHLH